MNTNKVWQLGKWLLSPHAQTRLARPLSDKTQMHTAQDIADDLSFFWTTDNTYILLCMYYCCKIECEVIIRSNAEIVCQEQTVMTRVAGDIQSSNRWNSGGRWLVLKPLLHITPLQINVPLQTWVNLSEQMKCTDNFKQTCKQIRPDKCSILTFRATLVKQK